MNWTSLLSLKRYGDTNDRPRLLQDETRLGYEVDYDRIIFSDMFRSLQDKTQVVPLSDVDFVHTRLTHSLEVSVVGRSLGRIVGEALLSKYPELKQNGYKINDFGAIVAAAALAHDIGNPPFGHSGERAMGDYFANAQGRVFKNKLNPTQWQDLIAFEGNANGFRLLTENRPGIKGGLRLSYATLGAFMKYPKLSTPVKPDRHIANKKYSVFYKDREFFDELAGELGLLSQEAHAAYFRHPLAYLVEAADDICYSIIDFEDGINLGLISEDKALEYLLNLVRSNMITEKYTGLKTSKDRVSYLRALAIQSLIYEAADVFIKNEVQILNGRFPQALLDKCRYEAQLKDIIDISINQMYMSKEVVEKELTGYNVLQDLLDVFITAVNNTYAHKPTGFDKLVMKLLPEEHQRLSDDLYERLINVCSYIAGMSDRYAIQLHQKIK
ncbi:MAG: deoxyguanosinetriphosphate triphosphohydrolase [Flavobacteriia bacterium]|nr:MAG: deoxyguanosinetriphosphate triphosphohydrolase [Flavobacteriia bacterium]